LGEPEIVTRKGKPVSIKRARRKPLHYRPLGDHLAERNP
jgi:hypothetical protein